MTFSSEILVAEQSPTSWERKRLGVAEVSEKAEDGHTSLDRRAR